MDAASFEKCFEHQAWVRALAARLCAQASDADDLEQSAWFEIARGTGEARSARKWLGGVVRHLARRERERGAARSQRERVAARPEAVPSADSLLAQAELQRRVLAAVAELDEAQRVVVLMHYYEGCDGAEIARRLGVPGSTVRSRLARAHARLRARLDGEYGGKRAAWSLLFAPALGIESGAGTASIAMGVAMKLQLAVAAAIAVGVAVLFWPERAVESGAPIEAATGRAESAEAASAAIGSVSQPTPSSVDDHQRIALEQAPAAVEHVLVLGDLLGLEGTKADGDIAFVDERGLSRTASINERGSYSIFGLAPGAYRIRGAMWGYLPLESELALPPGREKMRHDLRFERALVLPVRFVDRSTGEPIDASSIDWRAGLAAVATRERPLRIEGVEGRKPRFTDAGIWRAADRRERGSASAGVLEVWEPPPVHASAVLRDCVLETRLLHGGETELVFELDLAELEGRLASVTLRCIDGASGAPVEPTRVDIGVSDGGCVGKQSKQDGATVVEALAPGWRSVSIYAAGYAGYARSLHLEPGARVDLGTIELLPAASVRGRVVGPDGEGVALGMSAHVLRTAATADDFDSSTGSQSAVDGSFVLHRVERGPVRIVALDDDWAWTAHEVDARGGDLDGVEIALERGTEVWLRPPLGRRRPIEALLADEQGRVWHPLWIAHVSGQVLRLAPGAYELQFVTDNAVVGRQSFRVGDERTVVEVLAP